MYLMEIMGMPCEFLRRPLPLQLISSSTGRGVQFFWHIRTVYSSLMYSFPFQSVSERLKTQCRNALNFDEACAATQPPCGWALISKLLRICLCFPFLFFPFFFLKRNPQDWSFWLIAKCYPPSFKVTLSLISLDFSTRSSHGAFHAMRLQSGFVTY